MTTGRQCSDQVRRGVSRIAATSPLTPAMVCFLDQEVVYGLRSQEQREIVDRFAGQHDRQQIVLPFRMLMEDVPDDVQFATDTTTVRGAVRSVTDFPTCRRGDDHDKIGFGDLVDRPVLPVPTTAFVP